MTEALTLLGTTYACDLEKPIDCICSKRARILGWITGEPERRFVVDDDFLLNITAHQEQFEPQVALSGTETKSNKAMSLSRRPPATHRESMSNWTISVAQLPIGSTGQFHNMILIRDDTGRIQKEIDGGPADGNGGLVSIGSGKAFNAYTSGAFPIGAKIYPGSTYYRQDLPESEPLFSGTQSQIQKRLAAAQEAIDSFDPRYRYVLTGGPATDYVTGEQTPGFNSNSVAATLLWAMGIDPNSPLIPNKATPGSDRLLLELPQIRDLIQRRNLNIPEGDRIPLPPAPSEKRCDSFDGSYDFASLQPVQPMPAPSGSRAQTDPQNIRILNRVVVVSSGSGASPDARFGSWDNFAPNSVRQAPLSPSGGSAEPDPRNIRTLSRFVRAPDGSLVPAPLGMPHQSQTPQQSDRPVGPFTGQPMPSIPVPPSIFGQREPSTTSRENMDDWFSRWVKPLLDR